MEGAVARSRRDERATSLTFAWKAEASWRAARQDSGSAFGVNGASSAGESKHIDVGVPAIKETV